ncbi:MAG: FAM151A/B family protein [Gammaproteobacteria bacterium]
MLSSFLTEYQLLPEQKEAFLSWYTRYRKSSRVQLRPMKGVIETICWFQMQSRTAVGLKNICSHDMRQKTIQALKEFGKDYQLELPKELFYFPKNSSPAESAVESLAYFRNLGYHVICFADSETQSLDAIADEKDTRDILLLHADTVYRSDDTTTTAAVEKGRSYELRELVHEEDLPPYIDLVWHGINDRKNMQQFLTSPIQWGEVDVQAVHEDGSVLLQHDNPLKDETPVTEKVDIPLDELLSEFQKQSKGIKIDFKDKGTVLRKTIKLLKKQVLNDGDIWLNGDIDVLKEDGFKLLLEAFPNAIRQTSVDFVCPLVFALPNQAKNILLQLESWGINRFSISWGLDKCAALLQQLKKWGFEVNVYNAPDLEQFLKVMILSPRSITSDFNFPEWNYYGRGSGKDGLQSDYVEQQVKLK